MGETKVGVFLARMQPVHKAHLQMVELACEECDRVVVILGSENKVDMLRNPFDITLRKAMLEASLPKGYREKVEVYEIPDWSMESKEDDCKIGGGDISTTMSCLGSGRKDLSFIIQTELRCLTSGSRTQKSSSILSIDSVIEAICLMDYRLRKSEMLLSVMMWITSESIALRS